MNWIQGTPVQRMVRLVNRCLAFASSRLQTTTVINKPVHAIFEMSSACNLTCSLCNTGGLKSHFSHVKRGNMSFATFKAGLDRLLPQIETVLLYNWGEPFLNKKNLFECIAYATKHSVRTQISTNMTLYTEDIGEGLLQAGLTKLIVSCDGLTQETYEQYRSGGSLEVVTKGVDHLMELRRKHGVRHPHIQMQFIVFRHNEHEMEEFKRKWMAKGVDSVSFIHMSFMSEIGKKVATERNMVPTNEKFQPHFPYGNLKSCKDPYYHVTVNFNGDWYTCCFPSGETDYRIANIVEDDFWKIWNGPFYRYSRELIRKQTVPKDGKIQTMCHDCTGVYPQDRPVKKYWELGSTSSAETDPPAQSLNLTR